MIAAVEEAEEQVLAELEAYKAVLSRCFPPGTSLNEMIVHACQLPVKAAALYFKNTHCPGNTCWAASQACVVNYWSKRCCTKLVL